MKSLLAGILAALALSSGSAAIPEIHYVHELQYTIDRIEIGEEDADCDWVVMEVYDVCCDNIVIQDIKLPHHMYPTAIQVIAELY